VGEGSSPSAAPAAAPLRSPPRPHPGAALPPCSAPLFSGRGTPRCGAWFLSPSASRLRRRQLQTAGLWSFPSGEQEPADKLPARGNRESNQSNSSQGLQARPRSSEMIPFCCQVPTLLQRCPAALRLAHPCRPPLSRCVCIRRVRGWHRLVCAANQRNSVTGLHGNPEHASDQSSLLQAAEPTALSGKFW